MAILDWYNFWYAKILIEFKNIQCWLPILNYTYNVIHFRENVIAPEFLDSATHNE